MFTNSKLAKSVRLACAFGAVATAFSFPAANAQETTEEDGEVAERIQVTGSRIKRVDMESVSPVTVITAEDIQLSGDSTVAEVMRNSAINTFGSFRGQSGYGSGAGAANELNLRGLGSGATLVLIDGRRLPGVGYDGGSSADLSMIPMSIVERIEIVRDGASAVYGSDAVAGVVNIITKKEFDGIEANYYFEDPGVKGGNQIKYSFAAGTTGSKGSIQFVAEHENTQEVADSSVTGLYPDWSYSSYGPVARFAGEDGSVYYNEDLCGVVPDTKVEGNYCGYYYSNVTWLYGATDKDSVMTKATYELTDDIILKARVSAIRTSTHTRYAPTPVSTSTIWMSADNPMNPYGMDGTIRYRTATQGTRDTYTDKTNYEAVIGLEGVLADKYDWQLYYQYTDGKEIAANNNLVNDRVFQQLLDPGVAYAGLNDDGEIDSSIEDFDWSNVESSDLLDLFNVQGLEYQDWLDYNDELLADANHRGYYQVSQKRHIVDGNIGGEVWSNGDFSVSVVGGFEYEKLDFTQISDPESGGGYISGGSGGDDVYATRERQSYYAETVVMLPMGFEISGALRYDGYDLSGDTGSSVEASDFSDTVPKLGVVWRATDGLLVRASWGEAFRAPTMSEMYASRSFGFPDGYDQYYCDTLGNPDSDEQYCVASGSQHLTWYGGNPDLKPETSENLTASVVWDVTEDFSFEFGYFQYDYTNKIESVSVTDILEQDTDGTSPNVTRLANGKIESIQSGYANLATYEMSGLDLNLSYDLETEFGSFGLSTEASYTFKYEYSTPGSDAFDYAGYTSSSPRAYPDWRGNSTVSWSLDDVTVAWRMQFIGPADRTASSVSPAPTYFKHNLNIGYSLTDDVRMNLGVKNVFDKYVELWPGEWRGFDDQNYDPLGRTFTLNVNAKF